MKIGTMTFHGAYNYGSVLQAYALKEFITSLGKEKEVPIDYSVINYRTKVQKEIYWQTKVPFTKTNAVKYLMRLPYAKKLKLQGAAFEEFLNNNLNLTKEVNEDTISEFADSFDLYISGSDQIFNVRSRDFTYSYLLDFTENENKVSYAASLGPLEIDWAKYDRERYVDCLKKFKFLSLREKRSKEMVDNLLLNQKSEIYIDPTLLLDAEDYRKIQSDKNYKNGKYILFYCLEPEKMHIQIANKLSLATELPVVCTGYRCRHDYFNPFVKLYDSGPEDFLSLVDNAAVVLTSSFHGTAFSVIYNKPFWVIDGLKDNRISNLLNLADLTDNSISIDNLPDFKTKTPKRASETKAQDMLEYERKRSRDYILKALGI